MSSATISSENNFQIGNVMLAALIAGVISAVINVILYFAGGAVVGGINAMPPGATEFAPLGIGPIIGASIVPTLIAGVGLWIAARFIPRGVLVWQAIAVVLTIASLASPFTGSVETIGAGVVLAIMHIVVGGVMVWYLTLRS